MRALITVGPTREHLDPVRYLSNASSGRMGQVLARTLKNLGAGVHQILGPGVPRPKDSRFSTVVSARQMQREVRRRFMKFDLFISCAAVSDYRPVKSAKRKMHRSNGSVAMRLVPNPDILASVGRKKGHRICVGFALEDSHGLKRAFAKMKKKNCDLMVLNGLDSMESDRIRATILFAGGKTIHLGRVTKEDCARKICRAIAETAGRA